MQNQGGGQEEALSMNKKNGQMKKRIKKKRFLDVLECIPELFLVRRAVTSIILSAECKRKRSLFNRAGVVISCSLI